MSPSGTAERPILDLTALAEAGVQETTPLPQGNAAWDALGLVVVSFSGGSVLTSPRQQGLWRADSSVEGALPEAIRDALRDAIRFGRDASGRFRTAADWLETRPHRETSPLLGRLGGDERGWTEWEARGSASAKPIDLVRKDRAAIAGWLLAALLSTIGILLVGRLGRLGVFLLLFWLLAAGPPLGLGCRRRRLSGLAVGPMFAGLLVACASVFRGNPRPNDSRTAIVRPSTRKHLALPGPIRTGAILLVLGLSAAAAAPEPATVYLLPGPPSDPEPRAVLVTPELLERLNQLARPRLALSESAFLRARYVGRGESSGMAEFEAHFDVATFINNAAVALPVGETRIREILLDGAEAFPRTSSNERCVVEIDQKGEHRLDIKFAIPIAGAGNERELRFATPELAICELSFTAPPQVEQVRAVNWKGGQTYSVDKVLQADLGRARTIHIRWRQAGGGSHPNIHVQEASLWDIDPAAPTLYSVFDYKITQGSVNSLKVALPPNVEPSRVEIRPEAVLAGAPPSWVKATHLDANRIMTVDLQSSLTGSVRLALECIPNKPISLHPVLQFPSALDVAESEAYAAFRLHDLEAPPDFERRGVTEFSTVSFARDIWKQGGDKSSAPITRAFRRTRNESIYLRPPLRAVAPIDSGSQELIWWVERHFAMVGGTARWVDEKDAFTFVEWEVPAYVKVAEVRGAGLHSWLRANNRVYAWLKEPSLDASLVWSGYVSRGDMPTERSIFDLPAVRLGDVAVQSETLRLRCPDGWSIEPENPAVLGTPTPPVAPRELSGQPLKPGQQGKFILRGPPADAIFRMLSVAGVADRQIELTTHIEPASRPDRPHSFVVSIQDVEGWEVELQASGCRSVARDLFSDRKEWTIDVPRESESPALRLTARRPLTSSQKLLLPEIVVRQGELPARVERQLALLGPEIRDFEMHGWRRADTASLATSPGVSERLRQRGGSVWKFGGGDGRATVLAAPQPLGSNQAVRVILTTIEAASIGDRWVYRAAMRRSSAARRCRFADRRVAAGMRGFEARRHWTASNGVLPLGSTKASIDLPAGSGVHLLRIVWTSADAVWEPPTFESEGTTPSAGPTLWTACAPAGVRLDVEGSIGFASMQLRCAEALLRLALERETGGINDAAGTKLVSPRAAQGRAGVGGSGPERTSERCSRSGARPRRPTGGRMAGPNEGADRHPARRPIETGRIGRAAHPTARNDGKTAVCGCFPLRHSRQLVCAVDRSRQQGASSPCVVVVAFVRAGDVWFACRVGVAARLADAPPGPDRPA